MDSLLSRRSSINREAKTGKGHKKKPCGLGSMLYHLEYLYIYIYIYIYIYDNSTWGTYVYIFMEIVLVLVLEY